jgi:hypothetical protein
MSEEKVEAEKQKKLWFAERMRRRQASSPLSKHIATSECPKVYIMQGQLSTK